MHSDTRANWKNFTHLDDMGRAKMVNVASKETVRRVAVARGRIRIGKQTLEMIKEQTIKKGDIISVAKIAGILGAKQTSNLIPMCHQVPLDHILVNIMEDAENQSLLVEAKVETSYKTGVEMECLMAVSVTLLTIYDMCKSVSNEMMVSDIYLVSKTKG